MLESIENWLEHYCASLLRIYWLSSMHNYWLLDRLGVKAMIKFRNLIYFIVALQSEFEVSNNYLNAQEVIGNCRYGSSYLAGFNFDHFEFDRRFKVIIKNLI